MNEFRFCQMSKQADWLKKSRKWNSFHVVSSVEQLIDFLQNLETTWNNFQKLGKLIAITRNNFRIFECWIHISSLQEMKITLFDKVSLPFSLKKIILINIFFFLLFRETKAYYSVIVTATDNGLIPFARSSTSTLVIYITDENDNAPILVSFSPFFP